MTNIQLNDWRCIIKIFMESVFNFFSSIFCIQWLYKFQPPFNDFDCFLKNKKINILYAQTNLLIHLNLII